MALRAVRWEIRRDVIRVRRSLEVWQVAANARHTGQAVVIVGMAVGALAGRHGMRIG